MSCVSPNSCLRIVAVALLVASAFSAGLSHAHSGGNLSHDHHAGRLSAPGESQPAPVDSQLLSAVSHMHVYLFNFEFTVPAKEEPKEDSSGQSELLVSRLVGDDFDTSLDSTLTDWQRLPETAQLPALPVLVAADFAIGTIAVESSPLCDSARHERTGVLRI